MTESTLIVRRYQDVDGVINADLAASKWGGSSAEGVAGVDGVGFKIKWAPEMITALNALPTEPVWATTWVDAANSSLGPLVGHPSARVLYPVSGRLSWPSIDWKLEAILADQKENPTPFIWFDDEVGHHEAAEAKKLGGYAPIINPYYGITPEIIEGALEYIALFN